MARAYTQPVEVNIQGDKIFPGFAADLGQGAGGNMTKMSSR
jgi:hypothetical protein